MIFKEIIFWKSANINYDISRSCKTTIRFQVRVKVIKNLEGGDFPAEGQMIGIPSLTTHTSVRLSFCPPACSS
jgi:hypothetical protein